MLKVRNGTTFIRLPAKLRLPILGGCQCPHCKAHPANTPEWDTLASDGESSWTVHFPDLDLVKSS